MPDPDLWTPNDEDQLSDKNDNDSYHGGAAHRLLLEHANVPD